MSKQKKDKHGLLDREMPNWSTKVGNTEVKVKLGGRVSSGWTIRDFLKCFVFVWVLLLMIWAAYEIFRLM